MRQKEHFKIEFLTDNRKTKIEDVLSRRQPTLTLVLENINDPHNLSAVIRSCDAVGVLEVCLVYYGGQKFPKVNEKSSATAHKWVEQKKFESIDECFIYLRECNKKIYTTKMSIESKSLYDLELTQPVALVFGNEHDGVSDRAVELADGNFLIPQVGMIQSLNISVAAAVSLYEAFRQRNEAKMYDVKQFSNDVYNNLLNEWAKN